MNVAISQPMYFPWIGLFEQIRLADVFVHYTDVQYSKGGFMNRVQVKTNDGMRWMTVPLANARLGDRICDVRVNDRADWRRKHRDMLSQAYAGAEFLDDMLSVADRVFEQHDEHLEPITRGSVTRVVEYFEAAFDCEFMDARDLKVGGSGSDRVLSIVRALGGDTYITGHGARHYLDHEEFEANGVRVEYMDYQMLPYRQSHGEFVPYVTVLDLIAHEGKAGADFIQPRTKHWKEFLRNE